MTKIDKYLVVGCDSIIGKSFIKHLAQKNNVAYGTSRRKERIKDKILYLDLSKEPSNWESPPDVSIAIICVGISSIIT